MYSGQYYVLVQHPMQNKQFDIVLNSDGSISNLMLGNTTGGTKIFQFTGAGSLQGTDAATALINAIDDQNIDDMYTKLQFIVTEPFITIETIGTKYIGDKVNVVGRTNLVIDTKLTIDIIPLTFKPTNKSQSYSYTSGASITTPIIKGEEGYNKFSAIVDTSTFGPDEYLVTVTAIGKTVTDSTSFIVSGEIKPSTSQNTVIYVTTGQPVVTAPPIVTSAPAPIAATPIPTVTLAIQSIIPKNPLPGYGAGLALIGLCIVSFIIIKRK
jgi:hypothetical protein